MRKLLYKVLMVLGVLVISVAIHDAYRESARGKLSAGPVCGAILGLAIIMAEVGLMIADKL